MEKENNGTIDRLVIDDTVYDTRLTKKFLNRKKYSVPDPKNLHAFIPGEIRHIYISEGQQVKAGEKLLVLEAMKMRNDVTSVFDGKILKVFVKTGEKVIKGQLLISFHQGMDEGTGKA